MGSFINAHCNNCGYQSEDMQYGLGFGYGEDGTFYELAYCDHCGKVESVEVTDEDPQCSTCNRVMPFYVEALNDPKQREEYDAIFEDDLEQQKKLLHCPKCKKESLELHNAGLWD